MQVKRYVIPVAVRGATKIVAPVRRHEHTLSVFVNPPPHPASAGMTKERLSFLRQRDAFEEVVGVDSNGYAASLSSAAITFHGTNTRSSLAFSIRARSINRETSVWTFL